MKRICAWLLPLAIFCLLGACTEDGDEVKNDPELAESLVGLWYGESEDGLHHAVNLRADRTGVASSYSMILSPSPSTTPFQEWTAVTGLFVADGWTLRGECGLGQLKLLCSTGRLYDLHRIYAPSTDRCIVDMARLTDKTWTGYYKEKVITLEFRADGTMTRTDSPNAGWVFEETTQTSEWNVSNDVIHFSDFPNAWGVTVEEGSNGIVIFVDFGDVASAFAD